MRKRKVNHLINLLAIAMGRAGIRGYFTVEDGIWSLWHKENGYSLSGLHSVTVTKDREIMLELPAGVLTLEPEEVTLKNPLTAANSQEATRESLTRL
jgi:hypothetical protein